MRVKFKGSVDVKTERNRPLPHCSADQCGSTIVGNNSRFQGSCETLSCKVVWHAVLMAQAVTEILLIKHGLSY